MRALCLLMIALAVPTAAHEVRPGFLEITEIGPQRFAVVWMQPALADRRLAIDPVLPDDCATGADVMVRLTYLDGSTLSRILRPS